MENWMKQIRVRFSDAEQENRDDHAGKGEQRLPAQKTQSFKERRRAQNWFQRQLSRKMSQEDYDSSSGIEHVTAIAAAAFAVNSLEDSSAPVQKKIKDMPQTTMSKTRSKIEDTKSLIPIQSMSRKKSKRDEPMNKSTDGKMEETKASIPIQPIGVSRRLPGGASIKVMDEQDNKVSAGTGTNELTPESTTTALVPSIKKTSTISGEQKDINGDTKPEISSPKPKWAGSSTSQKPALPGSSISPPPPPPPPPPEPKRQASASPRVPKAPADAWEEAELAKIKERYEKLYATIDEWESKKKMKARRELDKRESELERRRVKSLEKFNRDMAYINQIAGGARAQANERKRNEELKAKAKANIIRTTGELPVTCFCF